VAIIEVIDKTPKKAFMLANEAVARALLEANVSVASFYPGSPTSEILDTMYAASSSYDNLVVEVASNEKVAFETAAGASFAGARSFTSMKSVGLNVASDAFFSIGYTGVNAGMVLLIADDPHAHSSQSEQDGRYFAPAGHVPMLEPATAQEAHDMVAHAFELSEKYGMLVMIRTTTRVNHQSALVSVGPVERTPLPQNEWGTVGAQHFTLAATARRLKGEALDKLGRIAADAATSPLNRIIEGDPSIGIITSGVCFLHTMEAVGELSISPSVLKLGITHPLSKELVGAFLRGKKTVVVVEELMPYLESEVRSIAQEVAPSVHVCGKLTGDFPYVGEYSIPVVAEGLASSLSLDYRSPYGSYGERAAELTKGIPNRSPIFCPGCPHRATYWAVQQALKGTSYVLNNDIGCYSMFLMEPYQTTDSLLCMGASLGISSGMQHILKDKVVAFVGDSTFFHAALPGLVNAVHNEHDLMLVVFNNSVTAMTGQQPNPGSDFGPLHVRKLDIEQVVRGLGVEHVYPIDTFNPKGNVAVIKEAYEQDGVRVVISNGPCALYNDRKKRKEGIKISQNDVSSDTCQSIYACIRNVYCPAIQLDEKTHKSVIAQDLCNGCGVCKAMCPVEAIAPSREVKK
jgi:indolepyruvate ferredoxin oxidoreductase alpha subunit